MAESYSNLPREQYAKLPQGFTDEQLRVMLAQRGYDVPLFVIKSWSRTKRYNAHRSRYVVERWLLREEGQGGRPLRFPDFLIPFDRVPQRKGNVMAQQEWRKSA